MLCLMSNACFLAYQMFSFSFSASASASWEFLDDGISDWRRTYDNWLAFCLSVSVFPGHTYPIIYYLLYLGCLDLAETGAQRQLYYTAYMSFSFFQERLLFCYYCYCNLLPVYLSVLKKTNHVRLITTGRKAGGVGSDGGGKEWEGRERRGRWVDWMAKVARRILIIIIIFLSSLLDHEISSLYRFRAEARTSQGGRRTLRSIPPSWLFITRVLALLEHTYHVILHTHTGGHNVNIWAGGRFTREGEN